MSFLLPFVLLSICCFSAASPQAESENEIISLKSAGEDLPSVLNQQQNCISDVNSVLKDMIVQVAKLEVEVKHLQRQNEEQSTTLKEMELQKSELEKWKQQQQQKDTEQQQQLQQQQQKDTEQQQQIQTQAAELVAIKTKANITEKQVEALRKDKEVSKVAFSTSLLASGSGETGPFNTHTNLIFRGVIENFGNAYNPQTGLFTAPVRGAYHFEHYMYGYGHSLYGIGAVLVKNGQDICVAYERQPSDRSAASNGATLLLEVGDIVFVRLWANNRVFDDGYHRTTFSGHLLFTM